MSDNGQRTDFLPAPAERSILHSVGHPEANGTSRLLTAEQVAERWQVPKQHVYRLARERRLPDGALVELGRYRRFSLDGIEEFERSGGTGEVGS